VYCIVGRFNGSRAILSGPAGGVVGYALTTYSAKTGQAVIGFDMGGKLRTLMCSEYCLRSLSLYWVGLEFSVDLCVFVYL